MNNLTPQENVYILEYVRTGTSQRLDCSLPPDPHPFWLADISRKGQNFQRKLHLKVAGH